VAIWHTYVGTFTKEFQTSIDYVETSRRALRSLTPNDSRPKDLRQVDEVSEYSEGIEQYAFDDANGTLHHVDTFGGLANPQNLTTHPTLPVLYAIEWVRTGRLVAFAVVADGRLERLSTTETLGELSDAVCVHPNGRVAYVAHWGDGTLTACPLDDNGMVLAAEPFVRGNPRGFFEREHLHDVRVTSDGKALLVTDVGGDEVVGYPIDSEGNVSPEPIARIGFPQDSHPRNLEFHPSGRFAYVGGQWDSMLHVLAAEGGIPSRRIASYSTMPPGFQGENVKIAQLSVHPNGHTVYVLNRNSNTIAIFSVLKSGALETLGHQPTVGRGPSSVKVHPSGRYLLVGNVFSGSIEVFHIDKDGGLELVGAPVEARAPRSFAFIRASA
jgi:6-phosphogluconolactonase